MALDLRKIAHFVAVAEEHSMTRAATRLHLSQQALSMSIRALERELGVALLGRNGRGVELLPAGQVLYGDAVELLAAAAAAVTRARRADQGEPDLLRIGHTPAITGLEVSELVEAGAATLGSVSVQVVQMYPNEIPEQLRKRRIDVGLSRAMSVTDTLAGQVVARHRLRVAVRAGHHLEDRGSVSLADLAGETLIVWAPARVSGYTDLLLGLCREAGFEPKHLVNAVQGTPPITAVLNNDGVALVTDAPGRAAGGAVRVIDLEPRTTVPVLATWLPGARSPARDVLLASLAR